MKYYDKSLMILSNFSYLLSGKYKEREFRKALHEDNKIQQLPADLRRLLSDDIPIDQIKKTLSECYEKYIKNTEQRDEEFRAAASQLTAAEDVINYFEDTNILCLKLKVKLYHGHDSGICLSFR